MTHIATYRGPTRKTNDWVRPGEPLRREVEKFSGVMPPEVVRPTCALELDGNIIRVSGRDLSVSRAGFEIHILERKFGENGTVRIARYQELAMPILPDRVARKIVEWQMCGSISKDSGVFKLLVDYSMSLNGAHFRVHGFRVTSVKGINDDEERLTLYVLANRHRPNLRLDREYVYEFETEPSEARNARLDRLKLDTINAKSAPKPINMDGISTNMFEFEDVLIGC